MPIPETLEHLWHVLDGSQRLRDTGWVRRLANPGAAIAAHVAVRSNSGALSLMIDIPVAAAGGLRELPATAGLSVTLQAISGIPSDHRALVIELEDATFADLFAVFCTDLVERLFTCRKATEAIVLLLERLARWQHFLSVAHTGLDRSSLVGLFGELVFLRDVLVPLAGIGIVNAWKGTQRSPQDFIIPDVCAVEIKTTEARSLHEVHIHGENQLDDTGLTCLFLACLRLEGNDKDGESLNDVIRALRDLSKATPEFSVLFERLLATSGYFERHAERYGQTRFRIAEKRFFRIDGNFPRLTAEKLPAGINEVQYRLELRCCIANMCTQAELERSLGRLELRSPMR